MEASQGRAGRCADGPSRRRLRARTAACMLAACLMAASLVAAAGLGAAGRATRIGSPAPRSPTPARLLTAGFTPRPWSGYAVRYQSSTGTNGDNYEASALFTVPTPICSSGENGPETAFWVGIENPITPLSLVQDGFAVSCSNGQPTYQVWYLPSAWSDGVPQYLPNTVQAGDDIFAYVYTDPSGNYIEFLDDLTQKWYYWTQITGSAPGTDVAAVAAESFNGGVNFAPVAVTDAEVNDAPIAQSDIETDEQTPSIYNGTAGLDPSPLDSATGMNFTFAWNGTPG